MVNIPDQRAFVEKLRSIGELVEIDDSIDWNLEMGATTRYSSERGEPAVLFNKILDAKDDLRALGISLGISKQPGLECSRIAIAMGLPPETSAREIVQTMARAREAKPIKPVVVDKPTERTNVKYGADIEINDLPLPYVHVGDGGRYLNTLGMTVIQSPDGKWTNWSISRIQAIGGNKAVGVVMPFQHIGIIHAQWAALGKDTPIALCLGVDPFVLFAGGGSFPVDIDEVDFVGGYLGRPVELVRCETNGLEVPFSCELVLEGYISKDQSEHAPEGPMGEYAGFVYQPDDYINKYVYTFEKMSYRDKAIIPFDAAGEPPEENHTVCGLMVAVEVLALLREAGIPATDAWCPFEAVLAWLVVSIPVEYANINVARQKELIKKIADIALHSKAGIYATKLFITTEDVDIYNLRELVWAMSTRESQHPDRALLLANEQVWSASPFISNHLESDSGNKIHKSVVNMLPFEGSAIPPRTKFEINYPKSLQETVIEKLKKAKRGAAK